MIDKEKKTALLNEFGYLLQKIEDSIFSMEPFEHIIIDDFLSEEHFAEITAAEEINRPVFESTEELIDDLLAQGYKPQPFPGCSIDIKEYLNAINSGDWKVDKDLLEGFGMAFRLKKYESSILSRITQFLNTEEFKSVLENKFDISSNNYVETAIQKYLHGYEISPHPDIRKKAATYMLNINTDPDSENIDIHTYLCTFKKEKEYIYDFWKKNRDMDRCWVPWDWCEYPLKTNKNNSIILFSPSDESLHAVKLDYDHLKFQRTQIYGNLWYPKSNTTYSPSYQYLKSPNIDIQSMKRDSKRNSKSLKQKIYSKIPITLKMMLSDS